LPVSREARLHRLRENAARGAQGSGFPSFRVRGRAARRKRGREARDALPALGDRARTTAPWIGHVVRSRAHGDAAAGGRRARPSAHAVALAAEAAGIPFGMERSPVPHAGARRALAPRRRSDGVLTPTPASSPAFSPCGAASYRASP